MGPGHCPGVHPPQNLGSNMGSQQEASTRHAPCLWCVDVLERRNVRANGHAIWERRAHISYDGSTQGRNG